MLGMNQETDTLKPYAVRNEQTVRCYIVLPSKICE
jgi:hypothetical protein